MYQLTANDTIKRLSDSATIPADPANTEYAEYLAWVADGNTPEPVPVPTAEEALAAERAQMVCSRFQARAALAATPGNLLASVEAAVSQADQFTQIAWADAVEFRRNSPTIAALQSAVGLTDEQIDDLFRAAMLIEA